MDIEMKNFSQQMLGRLLLAFPRTNQKYRNMIYVGALKLLSVLKLKLSIFNEILNEFVQQCLYLSISELPADMLNLNLLGENAKGYHEYIALWRNLIDMPYSLLNDETFNIESNVFESIQEDIYSEFVKQVLTTIQSLNLKLKTSTEELSRETFDVSQLSPENSKDFDLFLNLVELSKMLLLETRTDRFIRWSFVFLESVLESTTIHPLVSGFYKLIGIVVKICSDYSLFRTVGENEDSARIACGLGMELSSYILLCQVLRAFLVDLICRLSQFQDELLFSCIDLIFSCPFRIIPFRDLLPVYRKAIKIGSL
jgi:DNA-dependent protein kinase catalytic subunit